MDPRTAQTQRRLAQAVLELTRTRAPDDISVVELTAQAGISRVTFYDHYKSVTELLIAVLTTELDRVRELSQRERGETIPVREHLPAVSILRVGDHVALHRQVYENALLDGGSPAVERMLREHFETSLLSLTAPVLLPPGVGLRAAVRYTAHGMVGAISAWLDQNRGRQLTGDELVTVIDALQPDWWRRDVVA